MHVTVRSEGRKSCTGGVAMLYIIYFVSQLKDRVEKCRT